MSNRLLPAKVPAALVGLGRRAPRTTMACCLALLVIGAVIASRVGIETDILSLVPEHNTAVQEFKTTVERFGSVDMLFAVVDIDDPEAVEPSLSMADRVAEELGESELIEWVEYRLESTEETIEPLLDYGTLFMVPGELDAFLDGLEGEERFRTAARLRARLLGPQGPALKKLARLDPAGLSTGIVHSAGGGGFGASVDPKTGYLVDPGRRFVLILAKPTGPAQNIEFDRELWSELQRVRERAEGGWRDEGWDPPPPRVRFGGGYIVALEDSRLIIRDLVVGLTSSMIGVMILFLVAFGRPGGLLNLLFPLAVGLSATFAFAALALGRLNSLTSTFAALLIGLGVDFVIVLYGRFLDEVSSGASAQEAVGTLAGNTTLGVMLGATTTAATFFAFLTTEFRGLSHLGLITGVGILLLAASVFVLLPALLVSGDGRRSVTRGRTGVRSFGSDMLCRAAARRRAWVVPVVVGLSVMATVGLSRLGFDDNIQNMRSPSNAGVKLRHEVMNAFGLRFTPYMVRIDGADQEDVLRAARRLLPELEALVDGENLARVESIAEIVPPRDRQLEVIERLSERVEDPDRWVANLAEALRAAGLDPQWFAPGLKHLRRALAVDAPLDLSALEGTPLHHVVERYLTREGDVVSTAIFCYPPAGRWTREAPPPLREAVAGEPHAVLTGTVVVSKELRQLVWGDAFRAAAIGLVIVFVLMAADLGSVTRALLALVPLLLGMVWMLGLMGWLGINLNLFNIFVITMVIGIGVDYGVHLLHRWMESDGDIAAVAKTAKAVAVAALTTMVGFGSLAFSHYPALRSVGYAAILGALSTAVLAVTLLPALLTWRKPGSQGG